LVDLTRRAGLPAPIAALSGLLLVAFLLGLFVVFLQPYVQELVRRAPLLWAEAQGAIDNLRSLLRGVEEVAETMTEALESTTGTKDAADGGGAAAVAKTAIPDMATALGYAPALAGQTLIFVGTLFFFLLSRDEIYALLERAVPRFQRHHLQRAEAQVSRYFLTISLINAILGCATAAALAFLGMPSPILWGVLAFLFNFVPYLGPAIFSVALTVAGILSFDGVAGVLPVACFLALNMTEGQFVTPTLVGRQMVINPLLVFVALTGWLWLWGAVGGIVAIPVLVWTLSMTGWQLGLDPAAPDTTPAKP
jgi:predicted PurR-regulated permease PerM